MYGCNNYLTTEFHDIGLPTSFIVGVGLPNQLQFSYKYTDGDKIEKIIYPNNDFVRYQYDEYGRINKAYKETKLVSEYDYHFWDRDLAKSFDEISFENYTQSLTYNNAAGTFPLVTRSYVDAMGRYDDDVSVIAQDATNLGVADFSVHSGQKIYDEYDRVVKQYHSFMVNDNSNVLNPKKNTDDPTYPQQYSEALFEPNSRGRLLKSAKPGNSISGVHVSTSDIGYVRQSRLAYELFLTQNELSMIVPCTSCNELFLREQVTDEDGHSKYKYTNSWGQVIAEQSIISGTETAVTLYQYDALGRLIKVINPEKQETVYDYNLIDQLYHKHSTDAGNEYFVYNRVGQLTFSADEKQLPIYPSNKFRMYTYDLFGNIIKQERVGMGSPINFGTDNTLSYDWLWGTPHEELSNLVGNSELEKLWHYNNSSTWALGQVTNNVSRFLLYSQANLKGRLSDCISYDNNKQAIQYQFFSYNADGTMKWEIQDFNPNGFNLNSKGIVTKIDYAEYSYRGNLMTENIDFDADKKLDLQYHYEFDNWNRPSKVFVNYDDSKDAGNLLARYGYNFYDGSINNQQYIYQGHNIDFTNYTYDEDQRRLNRIQSSLMDYKLYYDGNYFDDENHTAYGLALNYNGNINSVECNYKIQGNPLTNVNPSFSSDWNKASYLNFQYDGLNRLEVTDFNLINYVNESSQIGPFCSSGFGEHYHFDRIGNFTTVDKPGSATLFGTANYMNYTYQQGTNHLTSTTDRQMTYDVVGNVLSDTKRNIQSVEYGRSNLPFNILDNANSIAREEEYLYNTNDERIFKLSHQGNGIGREETKKELYIRDCLGHEIAVMDLLNGENTYYVYGKDRFAEIAPDQTQSPTLSSDGIGDISDVNETNSDNFQIIAELRRMAADSITLPDAIVHYKVEGDSTVWMSEKRFETFNDSTKGNWAVIESLPITSWEAIIPMVAKSTGNIMQTSVSELMLGHNVEEVPLLDIVDLFDPNNMAYTYNQNTTLTGLKFFNFDHLGNTRISYTPEIDNSGIVHYNINGVYDYTPYAKMLRKYVNTKDDRFLSTQNQRDEETGWDYRNARFYDSELGRFLGVDPLADALHSQSTYSYTNNNPISIIDPAGTYGYQIDGMDLSEAEYSRYLENHNEDGDPIQKEKTKEGEKTPVATQFMPLVVQNYNAAMPVVSESKEPTDKGSEKPILESAGAAGYISHGLIGTAAELAAKTTFKYGQRVGGVVKSALEITAESELVFGAVAKGANVAGGATGALVNGVKAYNDYSEGNYSMAAFDGSKSFSYLAGTACLFIPGMQVYGGYILFSTMAVDLGGGFNSIKRW
jgi:RHS repeat-associated protein